MAQLLKTDAMGQKSPFRLHQLVCFRGIFPKSLVLLIGVLLLSESVAGTPTRMGARIAQQPATTSPEATRAAAYRALREGLQLYRQRTAESLRGAIAKWEEALPVFRAVGNKAGKALTIMQFAEGLSDRQAAEAVRSRIDWKYILGLELTDWWI